MLNAVRKFGLTYSDFPTMLSNISFFLRALSLNVDPRNQKKISLVYTIVDIVFAAVYCYVYLLSMIWFVFWKCMETGDLLAALIVFSLGASSEMGPYKIIFMFIYKNKLKRLVEQCLSSNEQKEPGSRFSINLTKVLRDVKKRAIIFWSVIIGNGFFYILKPIVLPGRHLMDDIFLIFGLEPIFETPNYQIAFMVSAMGVCFTCYLPSNATAFQIIISGFIEAQMLAWSEELVNLWDDAEYHYSKLIKPTDNTIYSRDSISQEKRIFLNAFVKKRLKDIVKAHAMNIHIFKEVENVFQGAIAVEFSLLTVCLIAELLGGLKNTYMEVPFALMQVGMDCFIGQRLEDASLVYERAVYDCKWEYFDTENMKTVLTMMATSQRKMTLSAGGITKLNFMSFLAIIKMIYSVYTTLSATID